MNFSTTAILFCFYENKKKIEKIIFKSFFILLILFFKKDIVKTILVTTEYYADRYNTFMNILDHRHPNCLEFDINGRLYIGDS